MKAKMTPSIERYLSEMRSRGGKARAAKLSKNERSEIARKAGQAAARKRRESAA